MENRAAKAYVQELLGNHPELAAMVEALAARVQGKGYEPGTSTEIKAALGLLGSGAPGLAVDIGGNTGDYTATLRALAPALEIHVFEPSRTNIDKLTTRFAGDARTIIAPMACGATAGMATLYADTPGSGLASLTRRDLDFIGIDFSTAETVRTITFEEYWATALGQRTVDLVKIDVEGHEMDVLRGFGKAIARTRVIQFEFGGTHIDTGSFFRDFWQFFSGHGFRLFRLAPPGLLPITAYNETCESFLYMNYFAVAPR